LSTEPESVAQFFGGSPSGFAYYQKLADLLAAFGPYEVRVSRSQVAFRRRRGFAYLWLPGRWLRNPTAEVVLSIALPHRLESARFKQIVHPAPRIWMHHLELAAESDLDGEVRTWLQDAYLTAA